MASLVETGDAGNPTNEAATSSLGSYVLNYANNWADYMEANYFRKWDEFYRLWRGHWAAEDAVRKSERSKIVTPALQQAVESSVSEVEEATFGKGKWFDIKDDVQDQDESDMPLLREKLREDLERFGARRDIAECLLNAAVFGTGIGEIVIEEVEDMAPASEEMMDGQLKAIGVNVTTRPVVKLRPIHPKTFRIDPVATCISEAHGCIIDEFVPRHTVEALMRDGTYMHKEIGNAAQDYDLEPDPEIDALYHDDKVRLTKYFGLVPKHLLLQETLDEGEEMADLFADDEDNGPDEWDMVEAIVVLANNGVVLKAEESPYMMQDRPIVAFAWDTVPGIFWGRGVCEKGFNSQKALDAEIRGRIDALSLTVHPMMALDATRIPRGHKPTIQPGKMILTNGKPTDVLHPFNFGQVSQITFAQADALQQMVQQSTGAIDSAGLAGQINGEATAAGISMSLGAIIKRQKRTLINFQEGFLLPFVTKAAWRYMQFLPEEYPVNDYKFIASSSLGIIAREYEVGQLTQLLQTMSPESPIYPALVEAIVDNMNVSNREQLIMQLQQAQQPTEEEQAKIQRAQEAEFAKQEGQADMFVAQAEEFRARARKYDAEAAAVPHQTRADMMEAMAKVHSSGVDPEDKAFKRRLDIANLRLKEKQTNISDNAARAAANNGRNNK